MGIIGYAYNVETPITFYLGGQTCTVVPVADVQALKLDFDLPEPAQVLGFTASAADPRRVGGPADSSASACAVAIDEPRASGRARGSSRPVSAHLRQQLALNGTVYTSVLNPRDDQKNWIPLVSAFCTAFADREDVTLLLKMTHNLQRSYIFERTSAQRLPSFACRGRGPRFPWTGGRWELIRRTHFYVNVSKAEGLCIPLMEFMSCAPALAPRHTRRAARLPRRCQFDRDRGDDRALHLAS